MPSEEISEYIPPSDDKKKKRRFFDRGIKVFIKNHKRTIVIGSIVVAFSLVLLVSLPNLAPVSDTGSDDSVITDDTKNKDDTTDQHIQYLQDSYYLTAVTTDFSNKIIPICLSSNGSEYIDNVQFLDKSLSSFSYIEFSNRTVSPFAGFNNFESVNVNNEAINLDSIFKQISLRLYFDISNFSLFSSLNFALNLSIIANNSEAYSLRVKNYNIIETQSIFTSEFVNNISEEIEFTPFSEKIIDIGLELNSTENFSIEIKPVLTVSCKDEENSQIYQLDYKGLKSLQRININVQFSGMIKVNNIICNNYNLTVQTIIDNISPEIHFKIYRDNITFSLSDSAYIKAGFFSSLYSAPIGELGYIAIVESIQDFQGYFFIYDEAGNVEIREISYDKSFFDEQEDADEEDTDLNGIGDLFSSISTFSTGYFVMIGILIGISAVGYFVLRKYKNKRDTSMKEIIENLRSYNKKLPDSKSTLILNAEESRSFNILKKLQFASSCISLGLLQTALIGILIKGLELLGLFYVRVVVSQGYLLMSELGIVFFIMLLLVDIIGEHFRSRIKEIVKIKSNFKIVIISFLVSLIQLSVFIILNTLLIELKFFGIIVQAENSNLNEFIFTYLVFFGLIFAIELLYEAMRLFLSLFISRHYSGKTIDEQSPIAELLKAYEGNKLEKWDSDSNKKDSPIDELMNQYKKGEI